MGEVIFHKEYHGPKPIIPFLISSDPQQSKQMTSDLFR